MKQLWAGIYLFIGFSCALLAAPQKISVQLQWLHQFQFAGFYMAKEKGYYEAKGMDVEIKEMKQGLNVVEEVIQRKSDFGLGRSSLLIDHAKGKPIVALSAIFQNSPFVLIATNPQIKTLRDLTKRRIMITDDAFASAPLVSMLSAQGLKKKDYIKQKHSFNLQDLIDGKTDAMASYKSNEPYVLTNKKIPFTIFDPKKYGFDFYEEILFTSKEFLKNNPTLVKKFRAVSLEGWEYAFKHIEETATLIYNKYNTQNKSLESLIYEGNELKKLAYSNNASLGLINPAKLQEIAKVYRLSQLLDKELDLDQFLDPYNSLKENVSIGVLAKRGATNALKRWETLAQYLNLEFPTHNFKIIPLSFQAIKSSIQRKQIDFLITNTMNYVQMEHLYGISRIAALKNETVRSSTGFSQFGGVIFTKADNQEIHSLEDIKEHSFGAVNPFSFGGWVMAQKEFKDANIDLKTLHVKFFDTHDATVKAVLDGIVSAGTVRTDTLEQMEKCEELSLKDIRIIAPKKYAGFPYLISTELYPEWPFARLAHTPDILTNKVLSALLRQPALIDSKAVSLFSWTIPSDYSKVHMVLKELNIYPYDTSDFTFREVFLKYQLWISLGIIVFILTMAILLYVQYAKHRLEIEVRERTQEISSVNKRLRELASIDDLTGISNRRDFLEKLDHAIYLSRRYNSPLALFSMDIDYFKKVNDVYGHDAGDAVLRHFVTVVKRSIRVSDFFGRMGGEEFSVALSNTSYEDALIVAHKIRKTVEETPYLLLEETPLSLTVSIGVTMLKEEDSKQEIIKRSDIALYQAKERGRNQVASDETLSKGA